MAVKKGSRSRAAAIMTEINSTLKKPILRLGNDPAFEIIRVPSGSLVIDRITGGGFALGRHIELYGDESTLKTSIAYRTMALSQERGNQCALIDPEHSFDPSWFEHLGGKTKELITSQPETGEDAIEAMMLLFEQKVEIVTVDSVAALATKEESERGASDAVRVASQARFMSQNLRRLTTYNDKTLVLWINQNRMKIGTFFGNPVTQPGGRALKFYDTARIELRRGKKITRKAKKAKENKLVDSLVQSGYWMVARAHKNKASREGLEGTFVFDTERGEIDLISEIIQLGLEDGIIENVGNKKFSYVDYDEYEWSGTNSKFRELILTNDGLREELIECIEDRTWELATPGGSNGNSDASEDDA